jgi:hypothetical protein
LRNWLSLAGFIIALGSLCVPVVVRDDLFAAHSNPYLGMTCYVVAPGFSFLGAFFIALGAWIHRRHCGCISDSHPHVLHVTFRSPVTRFSPSSSSAR